MSITTAEHPASPNDSAIPQTESLKRFAIGKLRYAAELLEFETGCGGCKFSKLPFINDFIIELAEAYASAVEENHGDLQKGADQVRELIEKIADFWGRKTDREALSMRAGVRERIGEVIGELYGTRRTVMERGNETGWYFDDLPALHGNTSIRIDDAHMVRKLALEALRLFKCPLCEVDEDTSLNNAELLEDAPQQDFPLEPVHKPLSAAQQVITSAIFRLAP
jgi:hypothetical protein